MVSAAITTVDRFGRIDVRSVDGEVLRTEEQFAVGELTSLAVSPDGTTVAAGSTAGQAIVLDAETADLRARTGGIGAGVLFHACCNLYSSILAESFGLTSG